MLKQRGFTLIEVMITVAIVAILATIAYPSYSDYIDRGKVSDGISTLADQRVKLEQFFQDNRNYGTGACGTDAGGTVRVTYPVNSTKGYFQVQCALGAGGASYVLTASTLSGPLFRYTVNQNNIRATTSFKGAAPTCANGWQGKKGETTC